MTQEVLKLAIETMEAACKRIDELRAENKALKEALAQPGPDIAALVTGMEVSIDVSTGDHDSGHRLFGVVDLVQENQGSKHDLILLVQEPKANFKEALAQPEQWGASAVSHPAYVAEQKRRTEELRSRLDQVPVGFAGVKIWIGNQQVVKLLTQTELHHAIDPWLLVKLNAEMCIEALKGDA